MEVVLLFLIMKKIFLTIHGEVPERIALDENYNYTDK